MTATAPANIDTGAATHPLDLPRRGVPGRPRGPRRRRAAPRLRPLLLRRARGARTRRGPRARRRRPRRPALPSAAARHERRAAPRRHRLASPGEVASAVELDPATAASCRSSTRSSSHRGDVLAVDSWCAALRAPWHRPGDGPRRAALGRRLLPGGDRAAHGAGARVPPGPPEGPPWAHPVDGVVAYVDVIAREVSRVIDHGVAAGPRRAGQLRRPRAGRPAAHDAEADRDHPARGRQLHPRRQPAAPGRAGTCASGSTPARA